MSLRCAYIIYCEVGVSLCSLHVPIKLSQHQLSNRLLESHGVNCLGTLLKSPDSYWISFLFLRTWGCHWKACLFTLFSFSLSPSLSPPPSLPSFLLGLCLASPFLQLAVSTFPAISLFTYLNNTGSYHFLMLCNLSWCTF